MAAFFKNSLRVAQGCAGRVIHVWHQDEALLPKFVDHQAWRSTTCSSMEISSPWRHIVTWKEKNQKVAEHNRSYRSRIVCRFTTIAVDMTAEPAQGPTILAL
ncbi:unnamed protein product [Calypogeia fissa]